MAATDKEGNRPVVLMTAARVEDVQFTSRRFLTNPSLQGYDEGEVDDFLDEIVATLRYYEDQIWKGQKVEDANE